MGNLTKNTSTFSPILINASVKENKCTRDILVSPTMTLYQLHKFILIAFGINESSVEYHNFTLTHDLIETSYETIDDQEIDGFITPVAPGVYIEHTHPHEPLPLFSIYTSIHDNNMTFRMLRDERYCTLDSLPTKPNIFYEMQLNNRQQYYIQLNLRLVNLPIQFQNEIELYPKIIHRTGGDFFINNNNKFMLLHYYFIPNSNKNYNNKFNEEWIKDACRSSIKKLIQERKKFLQEGHFYQKKCKWVEPSGEKCVYCTLSTTQ